MGIMVYSLLWVMQDFVHQPLGVMIPAKPFCRCRARLARYIEYIPSATTILECVMPLWLLLEALGYS